MLLPLLLGQGASGSVNGDASGAIGAVSLSAPAASASGTTVINGSASGSVDAVALTAAGASASGTTVINGAASGSLDAISLTAASATASGSTVINGNASGSVATLTLQAAGAGASGETSTNGNASGEIAALTLQATQASASGGEVARNAGFEMGRKVYIKRGKRIHIFDTVEDADEWEAAERQAQQAIEKAKTTSRKRKTRVFKALDERVPHEVIRLDWLQVLVAHFSIPVELPALESAQDWVEVARIALLARQMQDDEDIEMLLMA